MAEEIPNPVPQDYQATYTTLSPNLFQLTLTPANKQHLFPHAFSHLENTSQDSSLILQNLERWIPSAASLFIPRSPSTILSTPFRLIYPSTALPFFEETGLFTRQYVAISYCWRSPEFLPPGSLKTPEQDAAIEHDPLWPISPPFVSAILSDLDHPREGIWMDQLCIDQNSTVDKQLSVAAMDIIYRSCIRLLVLLEDVTLTEQEAALPEKYDPIKRKFKDSWQPESEEERLLFASFYEKVNAARWWERAWCFHEFNVNEPWSDKRQCNTIHNATFIVNGPNGTTVKIKWTNLQLIMGSALYVLPSRTESGAMANILSDFKGQGIFTGLGKWDNKTPGKRSSIMARHNGISEKGCMHLADRISIMLNMCDLGLAYTGPPIHTTSEVLFLSALLSLAAGEAYPLAMISSDKTITLPPTNTPTWLCPSSTPTDTTLAPFTTSSLSHIHRITPETITLSLLFLPSPWQPPQRQPAIPSPLAEFPQTHTIFPDPRIPTTHPTLKIPNTSAYPFLEYPSQPHQNNNNNNTPDLLSPLRRSFLSSCITAGVPFLARLWHKQILPVIIHGNYNSSVYKPLSPSPSLLPAAKALIAILYPVSTLLGIPPPTHYGQGDENDRDGFTLEDAHLFLTWLTDPRSVYYIVWDTYLIPLKFSSPSLSPSSPSFSSSPSSSLPEHTQRKPGHEEEREFLLITSLTITPNFSIGPSEDLRVAIPLDLLTAGTGVGHMQNRVWILRPVEVERSDGGDRSEGKEIGGDGEEKEKAQWRIVGKALLLGEPGDLVDWVRRGCCDGNGEDGGLRIVERAVVGG